MMRRTFDLGLIPTVSERGVDCKRCLPTLAEWQRTTRDRGDMADTESRCGSCPSVNITMVKPGKVGFGPGYFPTNTRGTVRRVPAGQANSSDMEQNCDWLEPLHLLVQTQKREGSWRRLS